MELVPDTALDEQQKAAEAARLAEVKAKMSDDDIQGVIDATKALKEAQLKEDSPEDLGTIPRVTTADLERTVKTVPTLVDPLAGGAGKLLTHPLPTAGVVYADVLLDLKTLALDELPYVRLLSNLIDEVGTSRDGRRADAAPHRRAHGRHLAGDDLRAAHR